MHNSDVATSAHRNQTAARTYSGRGERRPQTAKAYRTNHPFQLPPGLHGLSPEGRRWKDLVGHYTALMGADRLQNEAVRAKLRMVVWLTIELERNTDQRVNDATSLPLHSALHAAQELRTLLAELGLNDAPHEPTLRDVLLAEARDAEGSTDDT